MKKCADEHELLLRCLTSELNGAREARVAVCARPRAVPHADPRQQSHALGRAGLTVVCLNKDLIYLPRDGMPMLMH